MYVVLSYLSLEEKMTRTVLKDNQWARIKDLLAGKSSD